MVYLMLDNLRRKAAVFSVLRFEITVQIIHFYMPFSISAIFYFSNFLICPSVAIG